MIFILLSIFLNLLVYYFIYNIYGFIITNAIMVIIKTIDYKYRNIFYIKIKNYTFIKNKLTYLEEKDYEMKMKLMAYLFSYFQRNIPLVSNIKEVKKVVIIEDYISTVFKNKEEEISFLDGLQKNLL